MNFKPVTMGENGFQYGDLEDYLLSWAVVPWPHYVLLKDTKMNNTLLGYYIRANIMNCHDNGRCIVLRNY